MNEFRRTLTAFKEWRQKGATIPVAIQLALSGRPAISGGVSTGFINDLLHSLDFADGACTIPPAVYTAGTTNGSSVDLVNSDGPCFAIVMVGAVVGASTLDFKVQESAVTGSGFADVVPSTSIVQVTTSSHVRIINFKRTLRFVRGVQVVAATSVAAAGHIFGLKKSQ